MAYIVVYIVVYIVTYIVSYIVPYRDIYRAVCSGTHVVAYRAVPACFGSDSDLLAVVFPRREPCCGRPS